MGIGLYNRFLTSQFIKYNDKSVNLLANNLFEKIRQNGILPNYIERDRDSRDYKNLSHSGISIVEDLDFTFGNCIQCSEVNLLAEHNIGRVWSIDFEFKFLNSLTLLVTEDIYIVNNLIQIGSDVLNISPIIDFTGLIKVSIERNNQNYNIRVNDRDFQITTTSNADSVFTQIALFEDGGNNIGNFLIRSGDNKIVNWWKMALLDADFSDDFGVGDYSFYSFWFSYCYVLSFINKYREILVNFPDNEFLLRKFMDEKGIAINN